MVAWEFQTVCARIDLPEKPVHDAADPAQAASHSDWGQDARYSRDGRIIVSASRDGTVRVWDVESGKSLRRIVAAEPYQWSGRTQKAIVRQIAFVGDGNQVAAASDGNPIRLIEIATGDVKATFAAPIDLHPAKSAGTSAGVLFAGGVRGEVEAIDVATKAVRYRLTGHQKEGATAIAVSEKAGLVATGATAAGDVARVQLWRLGNGEKIGEFVAQGDRRPHALSFSRDGSQLAIVVGGNVQVYSVSDRRVTQTIMVHPMFSAFDAAFTADGKGLISCQSHAVLWDIASGKRVRDFGPFTDACHSVDVSPDGRFVAATSFASDVKIWEIATGAFHRRLGIDVKPPR